MVRFGLVIAGIALFSLIGSAFFVNTEQSVILVGAGLIALAATPRYFWLQTHPRSIVESRRAGLA